MVIIILQQIIDERVSFLKEQINHQNKPEVNKTFQIQIDAIRSIDDDDIEKVETIILQKKALLKNSKDVRESDMLFTELEVLFCLVNSIFNDMSGLIETNLSWVPPNPSSSILSPFSECFSAECLWAHVF
jgi:hypothetical protein